MPNKAIRSLGEIALRVDNLDAMRKFYENVIGLTLLKRFEHAVFFKIADGYAGHTQVLALFNRSSEPGYAGLNPATTTVDHLAFEIDRADYDAELARLKALGLSVETATHAWVGWRSIYVRDPEGNQVELVCHDPTIEG
ncbi:MAG TPA: VOC family protein [Pirellulales bacterium]|nr:VOC family protein [Pirellulales bacterium]